MPDQLCGISAQSAKRFGGNFRKKTWGCFILLARAGVKIQEVRMVRSPLHSEGTAGTEAVISAALTADMLVKLSLVELGVMKRVRLSTGFMTSGRCSVDRATRQRTADR